MQDNRRNTILNGRLTLTEALLVAGMLVTAGGSMAVINYAMADTKEEIQEIKEVHKNDQAQNQRAMHELELRLRHTAEQNKKEIRDDLKEQRTTLRQILRVLK